MSPLTMKAAAKAAPTSRPAAMKPESMRKRRERPVSTYPYPSAVPYPIAINPSIVRSWSRGRGFVNRRRGRHLHRVGTRLWLGHGRRAGDRIRRADQEINDLFADAGVFQINNGVGGQMKDGARVPHQGDNDIGTEANLGHGLHVSHKQRLSRLDSTTGLRGRLA